MTNAVIKAFGDLDSLRSCANDLGLVNEGLEEQGLPPVPRKKVVAAIRALAEPGAAPLPAEPAAEAPPATAPADVLAPQDAAPAPEAPAPLLPSARVWKPARDPQGRTYYYDELTGETTWTLPSFVGPRAAAPLPRAAPPPPREERSHARPAAAPAPAPAPIDLTADSGDEASAPPPDSDDDDDSATPPPSVPVDDDDDDEEDDAAAAAPAPATTEAPAPAASPAAVEGAAAPLPRLAAVAAGDWRIIGAQVQDVDDSTVRGVIVDCPKSWKEVATTTGSVVVVRPSQLTRATLTPDEAARCVRPASRKDYVQARIDGAIRFSHGGRDFKNCYTCADGTERRQFEVTATHVRCALCPDARTWSLATNNKDLMREVRQHCGQIKSGLSTQQHLHRLVQSAGAPPTAEASTTPAPAPAVSPAPPPPPPPPRVSPPPAPAPPPPPPRVSPAPAPAPPPPPPRARPVGRGFVGGVVQDRKGLEARLDADGWTREEKQRSNRKDKQMYYTPPNGGRKLKSLLSVARTAYPEFLVEGGPRTPPARRVVVDADDEAAPLPPDTTGDEALARKLAAGALLPMRRPKRGRADDVDEAPAFEVGARVRARWGQRWYPGAVDDVIDRSINDGGRAYEIVWDELDDKGRRLFNEVPAADVRALSEDEEEEDRSPAGQVPAAPAPPPVVPAPASPRPMPPYDPLATPPVEAEAPPPRRRTPVPPRAMDLETLSEGQLREEAKRRKLNPRPSDGKRELLAKLQGDVPVAITPPPRRGTADDQRRGREKKKPRQAPNGTQPPPRSPYMMGLDAAAAHGSQRID